MSNYLFEKDQTRKATMCVHENWKNRLDHIIKTTFPIASMNNVELATALNVSERVLFRKVKMITGLSPQKYIRQYRLQVAMDYLQAGKYRTVKETSEAVGYANSSYFILQFERQFNKKPFQVLKEHGWR